MNHRKAETIFRKLGVSPEKKVTTRDGEIYVAEGYVAEASKDFPFGFYRTIYIVARGEDMLDYGPELLFDALHDGDKGWDMNTRKTARINTAINEAKAFLKARSRNAQVLA